VDFISTVQLKPTHFIHVSNQSFFLKVVTQQINFVKGVLANNREHYTMFSFVKYYFKNKNDNSIV